MSGSGFDLSTSTFSQDGRIFQLEYAQKAIENSDTIVGIKCKDGIILASEKMQHSRLLVEDSNRVIFNVDTHIGLILTGNIPDGKNVLNRARKEAQGYRENYGIPITGKVLVERLAMYVHAHTMYGSYRPLGVGIIVATCDDKDYSLFMQYYGCTMGKGRMVTKPEIERHKYTHMTCEEALPYVAKMIGLSHKDSKEKRFEFEASWICDATNGQHKIIAKDARKTLEKVAEEEIQKEMMEEK